MDKNQLLQSLKTAVSQKIINKDELEKTYEDGMGIKRDYATTHHLSITEVLYYIGGFIVFSGISILIYQHWSELNTFTRLLTTLGLGILAFVAGISLSNSEKLEPLSLAFHLIAALVLPIGLFVLLDSLGFNTSSSGTQSIISAILFMSYESFFIFSKKTFFLIFSFAFGTILFFNATNIITENNSLISKFKFNEYRILLVGIFYMVYGYYISNRPQKELSRVLYAIGVVGFLGSALVLGGYSPNQNFVWELLFPILVFGIIFLSVYLKSGSFLSFGTIFLMIFIGKITGEYFSKSLGWPLSLVIAGLLLILIGFSAFNFNKKYLTE